MIFDKVADKNKLTPFMAHVVERKWSRKEIMSDGMKTDKWSQEFTELDVQHAWKYWYHESSALTFTSVILYYDNIKWLNPRILYKHANAYLLRVQNAAVGNKVSKLLVTVQCVEFFLLKKVQYDQGRSNFFCFGGRAMIWGAYDSK